MEAEFGIEGFVSKCNGFTCVLKQRYQDFHVHEMDRNGRVVQLTNLGKWMENESSTRTETEQEQPLLWSAEIDEEMKALEDGGRTDPVVIPCQGMEKAERTRVHHTIRQHFPSLQSATNSAGDGTQTVVVTKTGDGPQSRKRIYWPSDRNGDYARFVLYKENKDSHFAVALISRLLGVRPDRISLAGTKDKRGITSQLATVYRVSAEQLSALNNQLWGIKLGNFEYTKEETYLGDSSGNRFTVVMRNVQASQGAVEDDLREWMQRGFINYFGMQRFGTTAVSTSAVGKAILCGKWEEAVDLVLSPRRDASDDVAECYRVWAETKDPVRAMAAVHPKRRHTGPEGQLLAGLKKHGLTGAAEAFKRIPRNARTLYVHSLQSLLWNRLVSRRVTRHGQTLLAGDAVTGDQNEPIVLSADRVDSTEPFQLLIPLPSADARFDNEEMDGWYREILEAEGISIDQFGPLEKEYSLSGGHRPMFVKPTDVSYRFHRYTDPTVPLALSDYDALRGQPEPECPQDGQYLALSLSFSLPAGSYATMAIRELCRMDTGKQYQSTLNDYTRNDNEDVQG